MQTPKPKWRTWRDRPATTILTTAVTQSSAVALGSLLINQLESFLVAPGDLAQLRDLLVGDPSLGEAGCFCFCFVYLVVFAFCFGLFREGKGGMGVRVREGG
jgi:hypothetical protein